MEVCQLCENNKKVSQCDCHQCTCMAMLCADCLKNTRCRNCSMNCRNWLHGQTEPHNMDSEMGSELYSRKIFVITSTWTNNNLYVIDFGNKKDKILFRRATRELEWQISMMRNCFTLGYTSSVLDNLSLEYDSIQEQFKEYKKLNTEGICIFCDDNTLTNDERQRHDDFHLHKNILKLKKEDAYNEIMRQAEKGTQYLLKKRTFDGINHGSDVLLRTSEKAIDFVNQNLLKQERHVNKLFNAIKPFQGQSQPEEILTNKRLLWVCDDNPNCLYCKDPLAISIDRTQDDDFIFSSEWVIRVVFCSAKCAGIENLNPKQFQVEPEDNKKCPKCDKRLKSNNNIYDSDIIRGVFCNVRCAGLVAIQMDQEDRTTFNTSFLC